MVRPGTMKEILTWDDSFCKGKQERGVSDRTGTAKKNMTKLTKKTLTDEERQLMKKSERAAVVEKDPLEKMKHICLSRGCQGILSIGRMFRIMDDDGSRSLDFEEFKKGVQERITGDKMTDDELKQLFDRFDADKSGNITLTEMLIALQPSLSAFRKRTIQEAFNKLDKTKDGVITLDDIRNVYSVKSHPKYLSGEETEESLLLQFLSNFEDDNPDGTVTKDEFTHYYSGISASIDSDLYFDLMLRQAYKL